MKNKIMLIIACIYCSLAFSEEIQSINRIEYELIENYKLKSANSNLVITQYNNEYVFIHNSQTGKNVKLQLLNYIHIDNAVFIDNDELILMYGGMFLNDPKYITKFNTITGDQIWSYKIDDDFFIDNLYLFNNSLISAYTNSGNIFILDMAGKFLKKIKIAQHLYWLSPTRDGKIISFGSKDYANNDFRIYICDLNGKNISSYFSFSNTASFDINIKDNLLLHYNNNYTKGDCSKVDIYDISIKQKILTIVPYLPVRAASFSYNKKFIYVISGRDNFVFETYDLNGNKVSSEDIPILKKDYIPNTIITHSNSITVLEECYGP